MCFICSAEQVCNSMRLYYTGIFQTPHPCKFQIFSLTMIKFRYQRSITPELHIFKQTLKKLLDRITSINVSGTHRMKGLRGKDLNPVAEQRFSLKQRFAEAVLSCRLRKTGSGHCHLQILSETIQESFVLSILHSCILAQ